MNIFIVPPRKRSETFPSPYSPEAASLGGAKKPLPPSIWCRTIGRPNVDSSSTVDRERLVVVADPDIETGKTVVGALASWGLQPVLVHDGVEAMLTIQRMQPSVVILDAALPKMYGFQICEILKRNESLRSIHVILVGAVHHRDRYRRPPSELYGADAYMEKPELPGALAPVLAGLGFSVQGAPAPAPAPIAAPEAAPVAPPAAAVAPPPAPVAVSPAPAAAAPSGDGLDDARASAARLARIIVSDILLYHPDEFEAGLASGNVAAALDGPIDEGRAFFAQRVDARVREERDFILEELTRVALEKSA